MSPQERQVLQDFLDQLTQARGVAKDPEADDLIARAVARQPDAAYLLTQRALLVEQALNGAKQQIASLQAQLNNSRGAPQAQGGFLSGGNAWGHNPGNASYQGSGRDAPRYDAPQGAPMQQVPMQQAPMQAAPARAGFLGGGGSGFLGNVAATAAGVAGGAFLFQGIENLMGGHHGGAGFGGGNNDFNQAPIEETTVNNYYGNDANAPDSSVWTDSTDFADNGSSYSDDNSGGGDDSLV